MNLKQNVADNNLPLFNENDQKKPVQFCENSQLTWRMQFLKDDDDQYFSKDGYATQILYDRIYHGIRRQLNFVKDRYSLEKSADEFAKKKDINFHKHYAELLTEAILQCEFCPATPMMMCILADDETFYNKKLLPISCFVNEMQDNMKDILRTFHEQCHMGAAGGGIGTIYTQLRGRGSKISKNFTANGVTEWIKMQEQSKVAIAQGGSRGGSAVVNLSIHHPDIREFMTLRNPTGNANERAWTINLCVIIDDEFMEIAFKQKTEKTNEYKKLYVDLIKIRDLTGEPYILYIDNVNKKRPKIYELNGLKVSGTNLCSEIMLNTTKGTYKDAQERSAVCCLSSLNLENLDLDTLHLKLVAMAILIFMDASMEVFIQHAADERYDGAFKKCIYSVKNEKSIGIGVMGYHYFLQKNKISFKDGIKKTDIFKTIQQSLDIAEEFLIEEAKENNKEIRCLDAQRHDIDAIFTHKTAIAPTATISQLSNYTSPSIEPMYSNFYIHNDLQGHVEIKNRYLEECLKYYGKNDEQTWTSILKNNGSVQHLSFLKERTREIFLTFCEIEQRDIIEQAAARQQYIDQGQSLNLCYRQNESMEKKLKDHIYAWELKVKSLYYARTVINNDLNDLRSCSIEDLSCNTCQ